MVYGIRRDIQFPRELQKQWLIAREMIQNGEQERSLWRDAR